MDTAGVAYVAQPTNSIAKIQPGGQQTIVAEGGDIHGPTSIRIGWNETLYVTTRGWTVDGVSESGQVVEVQLTSSSKLTCCQGDIHFRETSAK